MNRSASRLGVFRAAVVGGLFVGLAACIAPAPDALDSPPLDTAPVDETTASEPLVAPEAGATPKALLPPDLPLNGPLRPPPGSPTSTPFVPFLPVGTTCSLQLLAVCRLTAETDYQSCTSECVGYPNCAVGEEQSGNLSVSCASCLQRRGSCEGRRLAALDRCRAQQCPSTAYDCTDDLKSLTDYCCRSSELSCGGTCMAACTLPKYVDAASCTCVCPPTVCPSPKLLDTTDCACKCPSPCPADHVQNAQSCACECPPNTIECAGQCIDPKSNPLHCGGCNLPVPSGQVCCDGVPADLQTSAKHCGKCNNPVPTGWTCCSGVARDLLRDPLNCKTCGHVVPLQGTCCLGQDTIAPFGCCNDVKTNLSTDPDHCGDCAIHAGPGQACCGGIVTNLHTDNDCRFCGEACTGVSNHCEACGGSYRCNDQSIPAGPAWAQWTQANPWLRPWRCDGHSWVCQLGLIAIAGGCCPPGSPILVAGVCCPSSFPNYNSATNTCVP